MERKINPADSAYPRHYAVLDDQAAAYGRPGDVVGRAKRRQEAEEVRAFKRLRNSKTPYPIFRRVASSSRFHYEMALEQARTHAAGMVQV